MENLDQVKLLLSQPVLPAHSTIEFKINFEIIVCDQSAKSIISPEIIHTIKDLCTGKHAVNPVQKTVDINSDDDIIDYFFKKCNYSIEELDINSSFAKVEIPVEIYYANRNSIKPDILEKISYIKFINFFGEMVYE